MVVAWVKLLPIFYGRRVGTTKCLMTRLFHFFDFLRLNFSLCFELWRDSQFLNVQTLNTPHNDLQFHKIWNYLALVHHIFRVLPILISYITIIRSLVLYLLIDAEIILKKFKQTALVAVLNMDVLSLSAISCLYTRDYNLAGRIFA